jgi:CRP/FNR family transcriptional regulator
MSQSQTNRFDKKIIPFTLNDTEMELFERIIERRVPCQKGELICRAGEYLDSLYIVLSGSFKGYTLSEEGHEQVTCFHLAGDIIGLDGIGQSEHRQFEIALETSEICEITLDKLDALSVRMPTLRQQFICMLSDRIHNDEAFSLLLNAQPDEARIAAFFHHLDQRQQRKNLSTHGVRLSMLRSDIANFLNLSESTINQTLQSFRNSGLISLQGDEIQIEPLQNWNNFIQK